MTRRIDSLTDEQRAAMGPYAQRWIDECLRSGTTDEDWQRAERGIRASYRAAGLAEPRVIVRTTSPLACVIAGPIAAQILSGDAAHGAVHGAVNDAVRDAVGGAVNDAMNGAVYGAVYGAVHGAVNDAMNDAVNGAVYGAVNDAMNDAVDGAVRDAVGGAVDGAVHDAVRGAVRGAVDGAVDGAVYGAVNDAVRGAVGDAVRGAVRDAVRGAVHGAVDGAVNDTVHGAVNDTVHGAVNDAVRDAVRGAVGDAWHRYNGGSLWSAWCAWRLFFLDCCDLTTKPQIASIAETWRDLSTGAGWWWPHSDFCIVAPRHESISRDDRGRLHCETGPALAYPDGWAIYSWHGTRIPSEWITQRDRLAPDVALTWPQIEQRRAAAEIIGWDRILGALHPRVIDLDADPMVGELLEIDLPDAPRSQFLRVLCGTGRTFVLPCVHGGFSRAVDANAASWGADGIDPALVRERQIRT